MPQLSNIRIGRRCLGAQKRLYFERLIINAFMLLMLLRATSTKELIFILPFTSQLGEDFYFFYYF